MTKDQKNQYRHWVSTTLIGATNCFENGAISKEQLLMLVDHLDSQSIDEQQHNFFNAYRKLVNSIEEIMKIS